MYFFINFINKNFNNISDKKYKNTIVCKNMIVYNSKYGYLLYFWEVLKWIF